ncbi:asparagine synthase (glutamine-hydrolyzing) [Chryseobacterium taklimakanense]|uniref:asparagine synthase (glutamine-hydrolyzing) n=1 Tax=Chryseobacterium taklimakanense TaxID=536441 RepID=UPI0021D45F9C|nr:asparagine synthase (glutamine-hydrolyzing) [Chryseobacterium taklimakanense]
MCGFCGFHSKEKLSSEIILKMNQAIKHRGPDDEGYFFDGRSFAGEESMPEIKATQTPLAANAQSSLAFGFRRLSIIELSEKGLQPMISENENVITFNGEIYNYKEIRAELEVLGVDFFSNSDTEVILKGYEVWGTDVIEKLDGMFSFCLFDKSNNKIVFARDRVGLKPLFYFRNENGLFWASEIKSLLKSGKIKPEINWEGVQSNFIYQTTISPQTCFTQIYSVESGTFTVYDLDTEKFRFDKYYQIPVKTKSTITEKVAIENVEKLIKKNVRQQLFADVPVISMMSGGIDSTLVTILAKQNQDSLKAFTLSYHNAKDEVSNAELTAKENGIKHFVEHIDADDIIKNLKESIAHFEEPYVAIESLLNATEFCKKNGYKVVFSGNGADELFGGYMHLMKFKTWRKIRRFRFLRHFIKGNSHKTKKIKNYLSLKNSQDFFRNGQGGMKPFEIEELFLHKPSEIGSEKIDTTYQSYFLEDMYRSLASHHAYRDDLSAMKNSVEFRYPYLSNDLIEYVAQIPEEIRFNGKINKPLLRKIAEKYVPAQVLVMKKKGFTFPFFQWYQEDQRLRNFIKEHLESLKKRNILNNSTIEKWQNSIHKPEDLNKIWQLVTFEVWQQTYFD